MGEPGPRGFTSGQGDYQPMFEGIYAQAGGDYATIPWASLAPHRSLVDWLHGRDRPRQGSRALVVGCGLGDDAESVAAQGFQTIAFDFSPTAIARCRERFPSSPVDYVVADLFALPAAWRGVFDLVVEIRTLQSMPAEVRPAAATAIAGTVAPDGVLFVHSFGAADGEVFDGTGPPWPVTPSQLAPLADAGLARVEYAEEPISRRAVAFTATYRRRRAID